MQLDDMTQEVGELCIKDPRLFQNVKSYINRAIRSYAQRRNWTFCHNRIQATVLSGATSVTLGANFKELTSEQSPISFTYGNYNLPVVVTSRERIESFGIWPFPNGPLSFPVPGGYNPIQIVFLEQNGPGGEWTLNVPPQYPVTQNSTFNVSAYWFPPPLILGTDHNQFTDHGNLSDAILNLAKSYAYAAEDPSNPKVSAAKELAEEQFTLAAYTDVAVKFQNRGTLRM